MAVETSTFGQELLAQQNAAEARALLEVGSGGGSGSSVASVNGKVGAVVLNAADVGAATAAQGAKADTALQPGQASGAITSVNGKTGVVVLSAGDVGAATAAQGAKADTALQPGQVPASPVQSVNNKTGTVVLSASDVGAATAAQGAKADTAVQPGSLAAVATSGSYNSLTGLPTLGTAAGQNTSAFATAAQGSLASSAVQPGQLSAVATSGSYNDLSNKPTLGTAASTAATAYATAAQGTKADAAAPLAGANSWPANQTFASGTLTIGALNGTNSTAVQIQFDGQARRTVNGGQTWTAWTQIINGL
jgi:hypothetical protein